MRSIVLTQHLAPKCFFEGIAKKIARRQKGMGLILMSI